MFSLSFDTYTAEDNYWRSSLIVKFDSPVKFLCAGDQLCSNNQFSVGNYCINHSVEGLAFKNINENLDDWLSVELAMLDTSCPTLLTAVHAENYHCVSELTKEKIKVSAITTAGIKSNAINIHHDRVQDAPSTVGTINIILCSNVNLTETAMAQALGMVYESKASLFHDNHWKSAYSDTIATGTGTDSVIIASNIDEDIDQVSYSGSHSVIAGMISEVVRSSIECSVKKAGGIR